ncbi:MAG: hypothetical protein R3C39_03720 [Dehalococcoidia bacterium]
MTGEADRRTLAALFARAVDVPIHDVRPEVIAEGGDRHGVLQWIARWDLGANQRFLEWDVLLAGQETAASLILSSELWVAASQDGDGGRRLVATLPTMRLIPEGRGADDVNAMLLLGVAAVQSFDDAA